MHSIFTSVPCDLAELLHTVAADFPVMLRENLVGIYLWGSLTYDAFDVACSDVDFVCVTRRDLDDREFQELDRWFIKQQGSNRWAGRMDMRFVIEGEFLDKSSRCCGFYHYTGKLVRHGSDANPIIWMNVGRCGITLWGKDAKLVAPQVSDPCLNEALLLELNYLQETLVAHAGDRSDEAFIHNAYAVLTACRILYSAQHRALVSKNQAYAWAIVNVPPMWRPVVHAAKVNRLRNAGSTTPQLERDAMGFVRFATDEVHRATMGLPVETSAPPPTPYPDLNAVLSKLVAGITGVLGEKLIAICLQGSFAVGDFDEDSDVDFIVVTQGSLDDGAVNALQSLHARIFDLPCPWAQHLEGSYFPAQVLRSCALRGEELWYIDNGSRSLIRSRHCNTAIVRQVVRERGVRLAGAEPAVLVDPLPVDLLREEIRLTMTTWAADVLSNPKQWRNRFYQGFMALNSCRMWCDWTTGTVGSKRRGAEWAKARLDASWADLIDRAWDTRPNPAVSVRQKADREDFERSVRLMALITKFVNAGADGRL